MLSFSGERGRLSRDNLLCITGMFPHNPNSYIPSLTHLVTEQSVQQEEPHLLNSLDKETTLLMTDATDIGTVSFNIKLTFTTLKLPVNI